MKDDIIKSINNPENLEKLYQDNKHDFRISFYEILDNYDSDLVRFWKIRLDSDTTYKTTEFSKTDILMVLIISLFTGLLVKLPTIFSQINLEFYYSRNLAIIVFNGIILYTFWQNKIFEKKEIIIYGLLILILTFFTNLLPDIESDSIVLSLIHTPLFLWCLFGLAYVSFDYKSIFKRIKFIRFNGELLIMTGLILIGGVFLAAITIGLFSVIGINIENIYKEYVGVFGGVAAPIVSVYLIKLYPNITNKIGPVIARVFTPLVLLTLVVYLISLFFSDSNIFNDRKLLLMFNIMLIVVMALIVFSVTELDKLKNKNNDILVLLALALLAIVINSIALIAIISRVLDGLTPNRTVVLGSNILIFINLILIAKNLYRSYLNTNRLDSVEQIVAKYLTIYAAWTIVVIFILPFIFGLK